MKRPTNAELQQAIAAMNDRIIALEAQIKLLALQIANQQYPIVSAPQVPAIPFQQTPPLDCTPRVLWESPIRTIC